MCNIPVTGIICRVLSAAVNLSYQKLRFRNGFFHQLRQSYVLGTEPIAFFDMDKPGTKDVIHLFFNQVYHMPVKNLDGQTNLRDRYRNPFLHQGLTGFIRNNHLKPQIFKQ